MDKTWTSGDARLLRELRQAAGIDRATLARRCALSVGQLAELEDGGSGHFYSERIKSHTGRAVLVKLGHTPVPAPLASPIPGPAPLPASLPAADPAPHPPLAAAPVQPAPRERVHASAASEQEPKRQIAQQPRPRASASTPSQSQDATALAGPSPAATAPRGGRFWAGLLAVVVAVVGFLSWLNRPQAPAPVATPAAAAEAMAETHQVPSTPSSAPSAADASAAAPADTPAAAPLAGKADLQCPAAQGDPAVFTPDRALRPAGYVYLEALQATVVCVTDAGQKRSELSLQPGDRINVNGTPPFTLQAARWADLRVFFQGVRVPTEDPALSAGSLVLQAR